MANKKDCFYIIPRIPFPPVGGDRLKYFNSIKVLSAQFNLHVIIISDKPLANDAKDFLNTYAASYKFFYFRKLHFYFNVIMGFFNKNPLQVSYYYFKKADAYCKATIKPGDIVICNLIRTALYSFNLPNVKILNLEDSIYLNYKSSLKKVSSLFWKLMYRIELNRLKYFEEKCVEKFTLSTFVNEAEQLHYAVKGNTAWIPNGVADELCLRQFAPHKPAGKEVVYLGKMDYQPNIDAVAWFANNVLPVYTDIKLTIAGAQPNHKILALKNKYPNNINITGYVDDPFILMKNAVAVVAPMQTGAGLQNKILEAMAIGCVVLASSLGANPIKGAEHGKHLFKCNTPEEYAEMIDVLLKNEAYGNTIKQQARDFIKENYTWHIYKERLFTHINKIMVGASNN